MRPFSTVQQFFKPLTDDQVRVLTRKHAGTPGVEQSVYLDEVGLQDTAVEVSKEALRSTDMTPHQREHFALVIAYSFAHLLERELPEQAEALAYLTADIKCAGARWFDAWMQERTAYLRKKSADADAAAALERERLALLIANDLVALLTRELPERAEALLELVVDIDRASARWVSAWAKGEK